MFQMKCQVTSSITRRVMISKEVEVASYKDVCGGEKKRVNFGYNNKFHALKVENNEIMNYPTEKRQLRLSSDWEVFTKFFSIYNIEPDWLNCNGVYGHYDEDLGGWTGCMGKV